MISRLLDLDRKGTWSDFADLVYGQNIWQMIETKFDSDVEQGKTFLNQLTCSDSFLEDNLARCLRKKGTEILKVKYSHVAVYHGCRPSDRTSYKTKGILPSNPEAIISQARTLFEGIEGFDEALQDIKEWYREHNAGKIGLLYSALRAKEDRNSYVLGSELIRSIANRLGSVARSRYAKTGLPTLIKCAIPVGWLENFTTFPASHAYSSNWVLEELIRMRKWPDDNFIGCEGGYMLARAVPPENILDFIDMTDFIGGDL